MATTTTTKRLSSIYLDAMHADVAGTCQDVANWAEKSYYFWPLIT